jgi:hypothetical protein
MSTGEHIHQNGGTHVVTTGPESLIDSFSAGAGVPRNVDIPVQITDDNIYSTALTIVATGQLQQFVHGLEVTVPPSVLYQALSKPTRNGEFLIVPNDPSSHQMRNQHIAGDNNNNNASTPLMVNLNAVAVLRVKVAHAFATSPTINHHFKVYANNEQTRDWNNSIVFAHHGAAPASGITVTNGSGHHEVEPVMTLIGSSSPIQPNHDQIILDRFNSVHHKTFRIYGHTSSCDLHAHDIQDYHVANISNELMTAVYPTSVLNYLIGVNQKFLCAQTGWAGACASRDGWIIYPSSVVVKMLESYEKSIDPVRRKLGILNLSTEPLSFKFQLLQPLSSETPGEKTATVSIKLELDYTFPQTANRRYVNNNGITNAATPSSSQRSMSLGLLRKQPNPANNANAYSRKAPMATGTLF